jgi:hypothetical protein
MFATVRTYQVDPSKLAEFNRQVNEGFAPILHSTKGFVAYYGVDSGKGEWTSVTIFETQEGADESNRAAAAFVTEHLKPLVRSGPTVVAGALAAAKRKA